jgi:hypothetical protein
MQEQDRLQRRDSLEARRPDRESAFAITANLTQLVQSLNE